MPRCFAGLVSSTSLGTPMLRRQTVSPVYRTNNYHGLFNCSPFASNRIAVGMPRCFGGLVSSASFATSRSRELWWTPLIGTDGTPATEPAQAFQFLLVGPENPGSADLRRHPPQDPPAVMPVTQGVDRHLQFPRQVAQSPLVAAEVLGADPPSRSRAKQPPCAPGTA